MKCRKGFEVSAGEKGIRSSPCGQAKGATASIPGQRVTGRAAAAGPRLSRRQSAVSGLCPGLCVPGAPRARTRTSGATSRASSASAHRQSADRELLLMRFRRGAVSRLQRYPMTLVCAVIAGCVCSSAPWPFSLTDGDFFLAPLRF